MLARDIKIEEKELLFQMAEDFYENTGACLQGICWEHMENTFALCLTKNPYARMLLLTEQEETVGFALLSFTWSNEVGGMVVLLEELYLKEEARGKGFGTAFMEWLEREYPDFRRFRLEVASGNTAAWELYRKSGYQELAYRQMVKDNDPGREKNS